MKNSEEEVAATTSNSETASTKNSQEVKEAKDTKIESNLRSFRTIAQQKNPGNINKQGVIFIIEGACLEVEKVGKNYQLLDQLGFSTVLFSDWMDRASDYRPVIAHQAIKTILDTPLNKSGQLKALFVKTSESQILIEIKPHARIPADYDSFAALMVQLLQTQSNTVVGRSIKDADTGEKVLRTIRNPVTQYLPAGSLKIGLSCSSKTRVDVQHYVSRITSEKPLVFVVSAMAHGRIFAEYLDDCIYIDKNPQNANVCIKRICEAVQRK